MLQLAAWLHNIDPFAIEFPEGFILPGIRWYGLAYLATFALGYLFTRRIVRLGVTTLRVSEVMDFVIAIAIAVVLGGRLGYVLFYKPELFITFSSGFPYWGVLQLNQGGMSSHGGMIGVGLVTWWYARRSRKRTTGDVALRPAEVSPRRVDSIGKIADHTRCISCGYDLQTINVASKCPECGTPANSSFYTHNWLHLFDLCSLVATLGFLFGRLANFVNAELIGRVCSADLPWAVKFPQDLFDISTNWARGDPKAAEQLLQLTPVVDTVVVDKVAITAELWTQAINRGDINFVDKTLHQIIHAIQDGGSRGTQIGQVVEPLLLPHHPSQLYATITEGLIIFLVLAWVYRKPRKPGIITGLFGALYGIMRVFNEFYRTPDAHIADEEFAAIGLTRGQLLSIVLALGGIFLVWWSARRNTQRMGGWLPVVK